MWCVFYILINEKLLVPPSRRLCNLSYIIWMIVYNLSLIVSYAGIQYYTGNVNFNLVYRYLLEHTGYALWIKPFWLWFLVCTTSLLHFYDGKNVYILISGRDGFFLNFYQCYSTNSLEYILRKNFSFFQEKMIPPKSINVLPKMQCGSSY